MRGRLFDSDADGRLERPCSGWLALLAAVAAVIVPVAAAGPAFAGPGSYTIGTDCVEQQAFVEGSSEAVAARLPPAYRPMRTESGAPIVFARALRCEGMIVDGRAPVPAILASYGVLIESPDGMGCGSASPTGSLKGDSPPVCNWYVISLFADRGRVVKWLRSGTPGFPVSFSRSMDFAAGSPDPAAGGAPFAFRSRDFAIDAVARDNPREVAVRGGYWADFSSTTVKLALAGNVQAGHASGKVTATPGSQLEVLLGASERPYLPAYSAFSSVRAKRGVYRKQVVSPAGGGDSFEGSCSVAGLVRFSPPAKNASQRLSYTYDGTGTCTGVLNGAEVTDAPVRMQHAGRSEGGCVRAETTVPSEGALTFAGGETIGYTLDFTTAATEVDGMMYGERSGVGRGKATFRTDRTPPDVAARCAGDGVSEIPMDLTFSTDSPLVAEERRGPSGGAGAPAAGRGDPSRRTAGGRLRVAVLPRRVVARRRTVFVVRVTRPDGRPAAGAVVRFAGRRARAGRRGRARVVAVLRSSRRVVVRATLPGFAPGRATVVVRRR
jgi:hypothetical protein